MSGWKLPGIFIPPMVLLAIAGLIVLAATIVPRSPRAVAVPIDLRSGAARAVDFRPAYAKTYEIGIEMDQQYAKRLAPCLADSSSPQFGMCAGEASPLSLSFSLEEDGADVSDRIRLTNSIAGGRYGGRETFMRDLAWADLSRDKRYRLVVRSLKDGRSLAPARPRLVVEVPPLEMMGENFLWALANLFATALALVGFVWGALAMLARRRSRLRTPHRPGA